MNLIVYQFNSRFTMKMKILNKIFFYRKALNNQEYCTIDTFKNLLEKSFLIKIDKHQADHIIELFSPRQKDDKILWLDFFLKFSQLE